MSPESLGATTLLETLVFTLALASASLDQECAETVFVEASSSTGMAHIRGSLGAPTYEQSRQGRRLLGYLLLSDSRCRHSARLLEFQFSSDGRLVGKELKGKADVPKDWWERIRAGMSIHETMALLGEPEEIAQLESGFTKLTYWVEKDGTRDLLFDNAGKLVNDSPECK